MENIIRSRSMAIVLNKTEGSDAPVRNLAQGKTNTEYIIKDINTNDEELKNFLFTLGCYEGESVILYLYLLRIISSL